MVECSFHPSVSSRPAHHSSGNIGRNAVETKPLSSEETSALVARLSRQSICPRSSVETVSTKEQQERQALQECTFQPNTSKSSRTYQKSSGAIPSPARAVSSSCSGADRAARRVRTAEAQAGQDLTFLPQTNGVSLDMVNAQAYLREDVFTRLSQATTAEPASPARASAAPSSLLMRSYSDTSVSMAGGDRAALNRFLERQNLREEDRLRRLGDLEATYAPALRPALCERSVRLAERRRDKQQHDQHQAVGRGAAGSCGTQTIAGFVGLPQRAAGGSGEQAGGATASNSKVPASGEKAAAEPPEDPECTFRPKITKAARERQARSPSQLGPADMERREKRRAKASEEQKKREIEQMQDPKIKKYNGVSGRLRIREDVDTLMERIEKARTAERKRCEQDVQRQRELEDSQCPFRPQVKSAPAFVQRMAATRRAARAAVLEKENGPAQQQQQQRPEWQ